jgi:hypothetical protein
MITVGTEISSEIVSTVGGRLSGWRWNRGSLKMIDRWDRGRSASAGR